MAERGTVEDNTPLCAVTLCNQLENINRMWWIKQILKVHESKNVFKFKQEILFELHLKSKLSVFTNECGRKTEKPDWTFQAVILETGE